MQNQGSTGWVEKNPQYDPAHPGKEVAYQRGAGAGSQFGMFSAPAKDANGKVLGNWPCQKPPTGNAHRRECKYRRDCLAGAAWHHRAIAPGQAGHRASRAFAGPIVPAGGFVCIGATSDDYFRAFDSKTGRELWETKLPYQASAVPMTYEGKNGKQYVAIVAAGGGSGDQQGLMVFALP